MVSAEPSPFWRWLQLSVGVRGMGLAAWAVAGAGSYYLWVLPYQLEAIKHEVRTCGRRGEEGA